MKQKSLKTLKRLWVAAIPILIVTGLLSQGVVLAQESQEKERSPRKGFVIGFDLGGGGIHFGDDNMGALLGGFVIGGGISEKILLLAENPGALGFRGDTPSGDALLFAPQFFVLDSFFVRPGIGFGFAEVDVVGGGTLSTDLGVAAGLAAGYEWRLTKRFALSPEVKFNYLRVEGGNHYSYGVVADLRWYF